MSEIMPKEENRQLAETIYRCARKAFLELFANKEHYYYCVLLTTGEGLTPYISAWSEEALERFSQANSPEEAEQCKWSFADSPYCVFGYEEYFSPITELLDKRPSIDECDEIAWDKEFSERLSAIEEAMKRLDDEGIFSLNQPREQVYINVECIPPDESDLPRALRLNNAENIQEWLDFALPWGDEGKLLYYWDIKEWAKEYSIETLPISFYQKYKEQLSCYKEAKKSKEDVYEFFSQLAESKPDIRDYVYEIMDMISGHCSPKFSVY